MKKKKWRIARVGIHPDSDKGSMSFWLDCGHATYEQDKIRAFLNRDDVGMPIMGREWPHPCPECDKERE